LDRNYNCTAYWIFGIFTWQILDARRQTRFFNQQMDNTGRAFYEVNIAKKIMFAVALVLPIVSIFGFVMIFGFFGQHHNL
jgi:hypothetical protein